MAPTVPVPHLASPPVAPPAPAMPKPKPPVNESVPVAMPVGAAPAATALNFDSAADVVVPSPRRRAARGRKRGRAPLLALLGVGLIGVGVAVWGGLWLFHLNNAENETEDPIRAASLFNCRFNWPGKPWRRDKAIEFKLHVNLAMRSSERNSSLGLFFKDYKTRMPSDAEMVDQALGKLRSYFQGIEWELKPKDGNVKLGGRPALALEFEGEDPEHVRMNGECYAVAFRGYAYWFFTWGPTDVKELVSPEWDGLRQEFTLLDERKGWTEKPRASEKVRGEKASYQLTYFKGLWDREAPQDHDPLADLVLKGEEPDPKYKHEKHASKVAWFQVLWLPKQPDLKTAVSAARDHVEKRQKELYPKVGMEVIKDKNGAAIDHPGDIGNAHGQLIKLKVQTDDVERFMGLAVVHRAEGVLVLLIDCPWDRRDFWDQEFTPLIDTLKVR